MSFAIRCLIDRKLLQFETKRRKSPLFCFGGTKVRNIEIERERESEREGNGFNVQSVDDGWLGSKAQVSKRRE